MIDADSGKRFKTIGDLLNITDVVWSPDSSQIAILFAKASVRVYQVTDEVKLLDTFSSRSVPVWLDDNKTLAGSTETTAFLHEIGQEKPKRAFKGHHGIISAVYLMPDDKTLITIADDNTIRFWETATGASRGTIVCLTTGRVLASFS